MRVRQQRKRLTTGWVCDLFVRGPGGLHTGRDGARLTLAAMWTPAELASETSSAKALAGRLAGVEATAKRVERAAKQVRREIAARDESAPPLGEAPAEGVPVVRRDAGPCRAGRCPVVRHGGQAEVRA